MGITMTADRASQQPTPAVGLVRPHRANPPRERGLRGRLALIHVNYGVIAALIAATLIVPIVVFAGFTYVTVTGELAARAATERVGSAGLAANLVTEVILGTGETLRQVSSRPALRDAFRRRDGVALSDHLADLRLNSTSIANTSAFDGRGVLLQRDPPAAEFVGRDFSDRAYLRGAMASASWYVSNAYVSRMPAGVVLASVSFAVREGPELLGVLNTALEPSRLVSALQPISGIPGREIIIVDSERQVVASSDASRELASVAELPALDRSPARSSGTVSARLRGTERIVTFAPIENSPWVLYLIDDPAVVLAAESGFAAQLRIVGAAAAVFALLVGAVFGLSYRALSLANRRTLEATARQAFTDGLTGLYNRHFMAEQLGLLHGAATRGRRMYSVVAFDADGLKGVNDAYGHETGDLALRHLADIVRRNIRAADIPVRTGGDEFVVILPDTDLAGAVRAAEHIVAAAESERTASPFGALGVSAGVAEWREDRTAEEVLRIADTLLMQAKRAGKGRAFAQSDPAFASA
jgi:diguanylate cyclase (GGDEF)-like protein